MAYLQVPTLSTRQFTWDNSTKTFVAEASDLRGDFRPSRLYDDACDVGIELESHMTGTRLRWFLAKEIRDGENELQGWEFLPTPEALRTYPRFKNFKVVVIND